MKKDELTKEFDGYMKDHPEIDYLSFNELETVDGDGDGEIAFQEWIEVSCIPGTNEGYYVHFRTVSAGSPGRLFAFAALDPCVSSTHSLASSEKRFLRLRLRRRFPARAALNIRFPGDPSSNRRIPW